MSFVKLLNGTLCVILALTIAAVPATAAPNTDDQNSKIASASLDLNEQAVQAIKAKNFTLAETLFRKALAADPKNLTAAFNLAGMLLTNKKEKEAEALLKNYTQTYQTDAGLYVRLGDTYFATQQINDAAGAYERAYALDSSYAGLSSKLATIYGLQNNLPDAERMLLRSIELNSKDGAALASLSSVLLARGKPQQAVDTAKRALQVKPTSEVYVTLGSAYEALRDRKNALIAFKRAVDLGDKRKELQLKIDQLEHA